MGFVFVFKVQAVVLGPRVQGIMEHGLEKMKRKLKWMLAVANIKILVTPNFGHPNPYDPLHIHSFHFIFHVLVHLIIHYWGSKPPGFRETWNEPRSKLWRFEETPGQ